MSFLLKQSTAFEMPVFMADSSDHVTGKTGLTLTITASKNGAAFASISPTVTELASGWYTLSLTTTHTNTTGALALHITSTGADPTDLAAQVGPVDANLIQWIGSTPNGLTGSLVPASTELLSSSVITESAVDVRASSWLYRGTVQGSTATTVTLQAFSSVGIGSPDDTTNDVLAGCVVDLIMDVGGVATGAGQTRTIIAWNGTTKVATVDRAWATNPTTNARYRIRGAAQDINVTKWLGTTVATPTTAGTPKVDLNLWRGQQPQALNGSGEFSASSFATGFITSAKFAASAIAAAAFANNAITAAALATDAANEIADSVWGADPTGYTASSQMGFYVLKVLKPMLTRTSTATAGGASTITLDGSASSTDDFYNGALIVIASGTGSVQFRTISDYAGFTRVATVDRAWSTNPDATSVFCIFPAAAATVTSLPTAVLEDIRDAILDFSYRSGRTVRGVIRRLGAALETATGLKGSTVTYFQPDGVTEEFHVTQNTTNGTRTNPVVTNSEVP